MYLTPTYIYVHVPIVLHLKLSDPLAAFMLHGSVLVKHVLGVFYVLVQVLCVLGTHWLVSDLLF